MRHDPAIASIVIMLRKLKMHGMAQAIAELAEQGAPAFNAEQPILSQLLKAETAEREVRSVAYQLKVARFPSYQDLAGFDFSHSEVNEALVHQLHRCEFLENANNVVLVGGPGTGKTHIATALEVQAIERYHRRGRFFSTVELVNALEQEKARQQFFGYVVFLGAHCAYGQAGLRRRLIVRLHKILHTLEFACALFQMKYRVLSFAIVSFVQKLSRRFFLLETEKVCKSIHFTQLKQPPSGYTSV